VRSGVSELIFFIISLLQSHEYPQIMLAGTHSDTRTGEFGADLVEAASSDAPFGTVDIERRNWRVVRRLLS
jgi:hypothetical protein